MEVRWFGRGGLPHEVQAWFESGHERPEQQPSRVDYYLRLPDTNSLGIKLREGKVEVKQLHQRHSAVRLHERVTGVMEHWRKWSFLVAQPGAVTDALSPASSWVSVRKERELRKYEVTDSAAVKAITTAHYAARGCYVELARLLVAGEVWWSLALEAFGDENALVETPSLVAQHVFGAGEPPVLEAGTSCGYPEWLRRLGG
jgi:hypothetical protein